MQQDHMDKKHPVRIALTAVKYICSVCLVILGFSTMGRKGYAVFGLLELAGVFLFTNALAKKKWVGCIVNDILILLFNIQFVVLHFGASYVSRVMLTNMDSVEDLQGRAVLYIGGMAAGVIVSFLPITHIVIPSAGKCRVTGAKLLSVVLAAELFLAFGHGAGYSPYYSAIGLVEEEIENRKMDADRRAMGSEVKEQFYRKTVGASQEKPSEMTEKPNVVLIFTEGLSQNIIDDERDIMPNVRQLISEGISFTNYYNHTFATYRGLIGQLYSGYQLNNYDSNELISLEDVFEDNGYDTTVINTEPSNADFAAYLRSFDYSETVSDKAYLHEGRYWMSDREAYDLLWEKMEEKEKGDKPFFITIYTFGTHASLDSPDEKFGDGSDTMLNKFHNVDAQFGAFFDKFKNSPLADDTLIVFTADHATYADDQYRRDAFSDYCAKSRPDNVNATIDVMPLVFYYNGIPAKQLNAKGRNTLDLAPTLLDLLDITHENYFLGNTLFRFPEDDLFEYSYVSDGLYITTKTGVPVQMTPEEEEQLKAELVKYYAAKEAS